MMSSKTFPGYRIFMGLSPLRIPLAAGFPQFKLGHYRLLGSHLGSNIVALKRKARCS